MKKVLLISSILLFCLLISLYSPWLGINIQFENLFGITKPSLPAGIQLYSQSGEIELYIDNKLIGEAKPGNPLFEEAIEPGNRIINVKRKTEITNYYFEFVKALNFIENTTTVITLNLGPSKNFSEGHIIYPVPKLEKEKPSKVNIRVDTKDVFFQINSIEPKLDSDGLIEEVINLDIQNKIIISKQGFEKTEFTLLPESQEERAKFVNYDINVEVFLMLQPIKVE